MNLFDDVGKFHAKFDLPVYPLQSMQLLEPDVLEYRRGFMQEELDEFEEAMKKGDLAGGADALVDLAYVLIGTAHLMGVPFNDCWREVQKANMAKERAKSAADPRSKRKHSLDVVKPAGWQPPDIAKVLAMAGGYDKIAAEYYSARHQTCRNFDATTQAILQTKRIYLRDQIIELGAGRGRCIEFLGRAATIQIDSSAEMLRIQPREPAIRLQADARATGFSDKSFGSSVAFLCDPFLDEDFLRELYRITRYNVLFSFPCADWALALRGGVKHETIFKLKDGAETIVPSNIWTTEQIRTIMSKIGFRNIDWSIGQLPETEIPSSAVVKAAQEVDLSPFKIGLVTLIYADI